MASTFTVGGLLSGLNTQDIISKLMALERRPLQLLQDRQSAEQKRLQSVNALQAAISKLRDTLGTLLQPSTINAKLATSDASGVVAATAGADAINGTYRITVSQLATATRVVSSGPMGQVIDRTAPLASAGFRRTPIVTDSNGNPATFTINGHTITVSATTTLDDGTANSLIYQINNASAGVTASLIPDADGRPNNRIQLVSAPGQTIRLGSGADTSNVLRLLNLADATVQGYTAATVTSGPASAGALSTSITINGVTTTITQTDSGFSAADNAAFIAAAINNNAANTVTAVANGDGTITLTHKTLGAAQQIVITAPGAGTGFSAGTTQNGTDRVVSTASLGVTDLGRPLASSRLVTPISGLDSQGNGEFKINGVSVRYHASDSITAIVNRINAANAGVTAFYDPLTDRLRLTATTTGGTAIALQDVTGNFLAATGLAGAAQQLGQNAVFAIEGVNGGAPLTSSSNTVTGYIPGVTLELKGTSTNPVTVTVAQNTQATLDQVRAFVSAFNAALDAIDTQTAYDSKSKTAAPLAGDASVLQLQRQLRSLVNAAALGVGGSYRSLADLGISTGAVGSKAGTTNRLVLDEAKLSAALAANPQAVQAVLAGFQATLGTPSGAGNIVSVTGQPRDQHVNGTYYVKVLDANHTVEVRFVSSDGRELYRTTGTLTPGVDNTSLIPGVTLRVNGSLAVGEDSFSLNVVARGVGVGLQDYLSGLLGEQGFFKIRADASTTISRDLADRIAAMEARLKDREAALSRRFTALETTLARLQTQSGALAGLFNNLGTSGSAR